MKTREYSEDDLYYINLWLSQRERAPVGRDELPRAGWTVVNELDRPVGCVFLRIVEGDLAIIDSLINDPAQNCHSRHQINDRLFLQCFKVAKETKLKGLMGTSLDAGTLERAFGHGFKAMPQTFAMWTNQEIK